MNHRNPCVSFLTVALSALLLAAGAFVIACGEKEPAVETPLHWVASKGNVKGAKKLIAEGANLEAKNEKGWTPLHIAANEGNVEMVKVLIEAGANLEVIASDYDGVRGQTPLHMATNTTNENQSVASGKADVVKALIEAGANLEAKNEHGYTPLHEAAGRDNAKIVKALLKAGANPEARNAYGLTSLHAAAEQRFWTPGLPTRVRNAEVAKALTEAGANLEAKDGRGWTPLHLAAFSRQAPTIKVLLKAGADPEPIAKDLMSPRDIAEMKGHNEIAEILRRAGG